MGDGSCFRGPRKGRGEVLQLFFAGDAGPVLSFKTHLKI